MKILHVHAKNLKIFEDALDSTACRVNGSQDLDYLLKSLTRYNCRDIMGLVIFRQTLTRKTLRLIRAFDELFIFDPRPIVVICDDAEQLYKEHKLRVKYAPLFLVNSVDGTISDADIRRVMTTLSCMTGEIYDLSEVEAKHRKREQSREDRQIQATLIADEVLQEISRLGGSTHAHNV